jgi:aminoglycoside phosphotransferase (APT) family kinase protein
MRADLLAWIEATLAGSVIETTAIGSGASREIWRVVVRDGDSERSLVARVDTGTGPVAGTPLDLAREAVVYGALHGSGLPVPELYGVAPDGSALLMQLVAGEDALAAVADTDERAATGRDYLRWLGRLHRIDVGALSLPGFGGMPASDHDHALIDLALWTAIFDERARDWSTPTTPFALEWLRTNAPASASGTALCHGDAGPGNFLFAGGAVTAMLDWEFAHIGDPHDDLAWVAVRNHLLGQPMDLADVFAAWHDVTGIALDATLLEYYRVFVLTRMAISCDATVAWKDGVEDDSIRTQVLLRPWLGVAITSALALAGCVDPELTAVTAGAAKVLAESPHADLLALIPPLEAFAP